MEPQTEIVFQLLPSPVAGPLLWKPSLGRPWCAGGVGSEGGGPGLQKGGGRGGRGHEGTGTGKELWPQEAGEGAAAGPPPGRFLPPDRTALRAWRLATWPWPWPWHMTPGPAAGRAVGRGVCSGRRVQLALLQSGAARWVAPVPVRRHALAHCRLCPGEPAGSEMNGKGRDTEPRDAGLSPDSTWEPCHLGLHLPGLNFLPKSNRVGDPYWRQMGGSCSSAASAAVVPPVGDGFTVPSSPQPCAQCHPPPKPASGLSFRKVGERCALVGPKPLPASEACAAGKAHWQLQRRPWGGRAGNSGSVPVLGPLLASPPLPTPPFSPPPSRLPPCPPATQLSGLSNGVEFV